MEHHWIGIPDDYEKYAGFVYCVTNKLNNMKYIGRKYFYKTIKGALVESDWKNYFTSSKDLQADIRKYGKDNFDFIVVGLEVDRKALNYLEVHLQVSANVLYEKLHDGKPAYYNKNIMSKYFQPSEFGSEDYIRKCNNISSALKNLYENGFVHPMLGKEHPSKGKVMPQCKPKKHGMVGKVWFTDGETNITLKNTDEIPEGFSKGVTRFKKYVNSVYQFLREEYLKNPNKCIVCNKNLSFARKARKTCSKKCQIILTTEASKAKMESGEHVFNKINDTSTQEHKDARKKATEKLKEGYASGRIIHPLLGKKHPAKGKKRLKKEPIDAIQK